MTPYDIPKVALIDGKGQERDDGHFFKYPKYMGPGIYDGAPPKIPAVDSSAAPSKPETFTPTERNHDNEKV